MCGIAGWLRSPGDVRAQAVPDELVAMADLQAHRGPDDRGYHVDPAGGLALAHNRLSIIDLSPAGRQPMFNEDRTIALAFNGEIYNFQKLRSKLVASGHQFRSKTDSEVILHAYEEWGQECVEKFCGMFAFVLWDCRRRELFAARDPLGIKPFYYWTGPDEGFYFASEMKAFRGLRAFTPRPCQRAVRQFLEMNFIYDEELTALEEVCKLPPGHLLTVSGAASGASRGPARTIRRRRWWSPPPVRPSPAGTSLAEDEAERVERFAGVFRQTVEQHLIADVRVGVLLSGGLDSSLVASVAQKLLGAGQRLRTISMGFAESEIDERPFGRRVADYIGTDHLEVLIQPVDITNTLPREIYHFDDLFGDWGLITTRLLYQQCREAGVKVVLVGEGSDEVSGGYLHFQQAAELRAEQTPTWRRAWNFYKWYSQRRWGRETLPFCRIMARLHDRQGDYFSAQRCFEIGWQLPNMYNMKVDKASMAVSVEARVPFQDVRVVHEAMSTPREWWLRDGTNKYLLRRMAELHKLLPPEILRRPKFGGSMPLSWLNDSPRFRAFAHEVVLDPSGWAPALGLRRPMLQYFDRGRAGYRWPHPLNNLRDVAWRLLLLNLWSRHYLVPAGPSQCGTRSG